MIVRRFYESLLAFMFLLAALPVIWILRIRKRPACKTLTVYGRLGRPVSFRIERLFPAHSRLRFLNYWHIVGKVFDGSFGLTGPRPVQVNAARPAYSRFAVRPGLVSPYELQRRMNIAFNEPAIVEERFIRGATAGSHIGLLLRYLFAMLIGAKPQRARQRFNLLDVKLHNHSMQSALRLIRQFCKGAECRQVAFVNPHCLNISTRDSRYRALLQSTSVVLADGIGIHLALKCFTQDVLQDNLNGTDLFPPLCRMAAREKLSLYLLGGQPGIAEAVAAESRARVPGLQIAGTHHGFFEASENAAVVKDINRSGADILLVAMGVPQQETWIASNRHQLNTRIAMGVGGLFDFYSGRIARAPLWMREIGLEWLYRLIQEPGRMWRRYVIGNPLFLWRVWRWSRKSSPAGAGQTLGRDLVV